MLPDGMVNAWMRKVRITKKRRTAIPKDLIHSASSSRFVGGVDRPCEVAEPSTLFFDAFEAKYYLQSVFVFRSGPARPEASRRRYRDELYSTGFRQVSNSGLHRS